MFNCIIVASNVINDMRSFLVSKGTQFCDITLVLDGECIPAHKAVLAARSRYFEAMFRNFMPSNNRVNVSKSFLLLYVTVALL